MYVSCSSKELKQKNSLQTVNTAKTRKFPFLKDGLKINGDGGGTVVKVLCYKSECCWFDPSWCH